MYMKDHYKVLDLERSCTSKDIKNKAKKLLDNIKKSKVKLEKKNELKNQVFESYKFLMDYHKRKSLDDYIDSVNNKVEYNIIETPGIDSKQFHDFFMPFPINLTSIHDSLVDFEEEMMKEFEDKSRDSTHSTKLNEFNYQYKSFKSSIDSEGILSNQIKLPKKIYNFDYSN